MPKETSEPESKAWKPSTTAPATGTGLGRARTSR